ncbi:lytic transglycosylase domain-containing protein [uncultured Jannaschia sp.]|uniref:lytic transglycosylase domain-containing protein n=1 Tax=uncultured Jannaschia sp. TaxID=293347 RepID=UPI002624242E|nr:lytic transglycosylase domain-containing protein [uncultured Jannaschia sp.]
MIRFFLAPLAALLLSLPAAADPALGRGLSALRDGQLDEARATLSEIVDPVARDVLHWHLLRLRRGGFAEGEAFLARNGDWPGLDLLRARVELDIPVTTEPDRIAAFFAADPPQTGKGALLLAVALRALDLPAEAEVVAVEAWLGLPMTASTEAGFLELFGELLRPFDAARLDALLWAGETDAAERTLRRVSGPEAALARARIALRIGAGNVDTLIAAVPDGYRDHPGLAYERFRWRLDKGRTEDALELLFAYDESADTLGNPAAWGDHRERLARGQMQDGHHADAYRIAARNHLREGGEEVAGNEWLAGYIALRFLDRPEVAAAHFRTFDASVASPISKGRAGYWLGRALEASGDLAGAGTAYAAGARYQTSFYGQLAAARGNLPADPRLAGTETFPPLDETSFADSSVLAAARLLGGMGEQNLAERFLTHLAEGLQREEIGTLIDVALDELEDPHVALLIAKRAAQAGHELHRGYFPVTELAAMDSPVAPELALSIARRESEFDPVVVSHAGAAGLMQLMPGTAREMAGLVGLPYRPAALTREPDYNARLGTAYLGELEVEFGHSPILVPAAYNAGPSRARLWSLEMGHPGLPSVDVVDWIEDVPFSETRNYIMRVSESLLPYHARMTGEVDRVPLPDWLKGGYGDLARHGVRSSRNE